MKARIKALIFITAALTVASCSAPMMLEFERSITVYAVDFRPYVESGFFFYTDECPGPHRQLGTIRVEIHPATVTKKDNPPKRPKRGRYDDSVYSKRDVSYHTETEVLASKDLLDPIMSAAKEMGGNGIAHLEIRYDDRKYYVRGTAVLCKQP